jgi:hypothetical protein
VRLHRCEVRTGNDVLVQPWGSDVGIEVGEEPWFTNALMILEEQGQQPPGSRLSSLPCRSGHLWGTEGPDEMLGMLLCEMVLTQRIPRLVGHRAGRRHVQKRNHEEGTLAVLQRISRRAVSVRRPFCKPTGVILSSFAASWSRSRGRIPRARASRPGRGGRSGARLAAVVDLVANDPRRAG